MRVETCALAASEKPVLWNLLQNYIREMAAYDPAINPQDPSFEYPFIDNYWTDADRWPFSMKVDGNVAGFGLVRKLEDGTTEMAEFYVCPEYRRTGAGLVFARDLLARFAGPWELSEYQANVGAIAFWRKVIGDRAFTEHTYISLNGNPRIAQNFTV
jgi:predicted acetyltransferase